MQAEAALEDALINRFGCLGRVPQTFKLRSDNGLVFCSKTYTSLVKDSGLSQEFITPYTPQQNGMVERLIRTIKEQCVYPHRCENIRHAERALADWIRFIMKSDHISLMDIMEIKAICPSQKTSVKMRGIIY